MNQHTLNLLLRLRAISIVAILGLILICAGIGIIAVVVPRESLRLQDLQRQRGHPELPEETSAKKNSEASRRLARWQTFQGHLGDSASVPKQLNAIYGLADRHGLQLSSGQYTASLDPSLAYSVYDIRLPVEGSYRAIRDFCEDVLLALPHSTLESLSFKRGSTESGIVQADVHLSLYLTPHQWPAGVHTGGAPQ